VQGLWGQNLFAGDVVELPVNLCMLLVNQRSAVFVLDSETAKDEKLIAELEQKGYAFATTVKPAREREEFQSVIARKTKTKSNWMAPILNPEKPWMCQRAAGCFSFNNREWEIVLFNRCRSGAAKIGIFFKAVTKADRLKRLCSLEAYLVLDRLETALRRKRAVRTPFSTAPQRQTTKATARRCFRCFVASPLPGSVYCPACLQKYHSWTRNRSFKKVTLSLS
jgi:hypothetical protein